MRLAVLDPARFVTAVVRCFSAFPVRLDATFLVDELPLVALGTAASALRTADFFTVAEVFRGADPITGSVFFRGADFFTAVVFFRAAPFFAAARSAADFVVFLLPAFTGVRIDADFVVEGFAARAVGFFRGVGAMVVVFAPSPPTGCRTRIRIASTFTVVSSGNETPRISGALATLNN